jgi:hypothetical protein
MGIIDAMANIVTATMQWDPNFGETRVDLRRRRSTSTDSARSSPIRLPAPAERPTSR